MHHRARLDGRAERHRGDAGWADPRTVGRAAAEHGVANLLYLSARELPTLDPELRSLLGTVYHLNLTHHMKVIGELTSLAATLDAAGVPFMVVKGPVAGRGDLPAQRHAVVR